MLLTISAFLTFLCGLGCIILSVYIMITVNNRSDDILIAMGMFVGASSVLYYVIKTKFGKKETVADKIEMENDALRKKIEQKKLIKELKEMTE